MMEYHTIQYNTIQFDAIRYNATNYNCVVLCAVADLTRYGAETQPCGLLQDLCLLGAAWV